MGNNLTFYSVSTPQMTALMNAMKADGAEMVEDGVIEGDTPVGKIKARYVYSASSGQLSVEVLDKPLLLSMDTIQHRLQEKLNGAAEEAERTAKATPVVAEEPPVPPTPPQPVVIESLTTEPPPSA